MCRLGVCRVLENGFTSSSGIGKFHRAFDEGREDLCGPGGVQLVEDFPGMAGARVIHGTENFQLHRGIGFLADVLNDL